TLPWVVSGFTADALRDQAARLRDHIERHPDAEVGVVARALATTRTAFRHRAAVIATDRDGFVRGLEALADDEPAPGVVRGTACPDPKVAVVFTGSTTRSPRVRPELSAAFPVFARALDGACRALGPRLGPSVRDVLDGRAAPDGETIQPALFAADVALFRQFEEWGVAPDFVAGAGLGEITAAHVAGVLDLADAALLVAARARLARAPEGATSSVARDIEEFARRACRCASWPPRISLVSAQVNGLVTDRVRSTDYWLHHARASRRDGAGMSHATRPLHDLGATVILAPGGVGTPGPVRDVAPGAPPVPIVDVRAGGIDSSAPSDVVAALAELYANGVEVGWDRILPVGGPSRRTRTRLNLPTYAFQRSRHWLPRHPGEQAGPTPPPP
ncbi:acyltransferase domain-containing protein, partial [Nocardiopsis gilva]